MACFFMPHHASGDTCTTISGDIVSAIVGGIGRKREYTVMGVLIVRGLVYTRSGISGSGADTVH